jgi:hypothetical protein
MCFRRRREAETDPSPSAEQVRKHLNSLYHLQACVGISSLELNFYISTYVLSFASRLVANHSFILGEKALSSNGRYKYSREMAP